MARAGSSQDADLFGSTGGHGRFGSLIDHGETYGRHIIQRFAAQLPDVRTFVDLGAGHGWDIKTVLASHPGAQSIAIDNGDWPGVVNVDIERDRLPFADESMDLVMANQVIEHCKEVFWIFHEATRVLRVGGHMIVGVPNVASFHNRLLLLTGRQPSQHKLASAHVRPFSKADTIMFLEACFPGGYHLDDFAGAQFYPLPRGLARAACSVWPGAAFSIFFLLRKTRPYGDEGFRTYPARARLETSFWTGGASMENP